MICSDWISKALMIECFSNLIISKDNYCLLEDYQSILLQKLKIRNTRSDLNQWDLPGKFIPNGESLSSKTVK